MNYQIVRNIIGKIMILLAMLMFLPLIVCIIYQEEFINYVENLMNGEKPEMTENVKLYWEAFKGQEEVDKPLFTDNGKLILQCMKDHTETPMWKSRDIAEVLFISSRAVSGAMRKLVSDGYVEKIGKDPVAYSITEKGKSFSLT